MFTFSYFFRYAIGGLSGGEAKDAFWRVVAQCTAGLPEDKPRYVMVNISISSFVKLGMERIKHSKVMWSTNYGSYLNGRVHQ